MFRINHQISTETLPKTQVKGSLLLCSIRKPCCPLNHGEAPVQLSRQTPLRCSASPPLGQLCPHPQARNQHHWIGDGFPGSSASKESACNAGDPGSIPGSGRSAGEGIGYPLQYAWASLVAQLVKNPPAMWETGFHPWVGKIPWRRAWNPLQYSCLENPYGQRRLEGYSPWGHKESDMTERLSTNRWQDHEEGVPNSIWHSTAHWKTSGSETHRHHNRKAQVQCSQESH